MPISELESQQVQNRRRRMAHYIYYAQLHEGLFDTIPNGVTDAGSVITAANETARYALPGLSPGAQVYQTDNSTLYQLNAPSTAQGGVFVSGGTHDGIYAINGEFGGKSVFDLLGGSPSNDAISWNFDRWSISEVINGGTPYYSLSDVTTPDLATNWKNYSDDTLASITVTSITQGELDAGVTVAGAGSSTSNGDYVVNGNTGARNTYVRGDFTGWFGFGNISSFWGDGNYSGTNAPAFLWDSDWLIDNGVLPTPTVTRNDTAAPANWTPI